MPDVLLPLIGIIAGLALLSFASEQFVIGAARIAGSLGWSPIVIGAVVIGFGTSAPEMLVSGLAAAQGELPIAVGNIIGSNVANLSLVLGSAALVVPLTVTTRTLRQELPLSLGAVLLFGVLVQDGLTRIEGAVMVLALVVVLWTILAGVGDDDVDDDLTGEVAEYLGEEAHDLRFESMRTLGGLVGTVAAAQLLVTSAVEVAAILGLDAGFVGLTIIAIGTSLPELATALQAARRDETDLVIGNLLGSNIFNSLGVGGVAALAGPAVLDGTSLTGQATILMIVVVAGATVAMATGRVVRRAEAGLLLAVYVGALPLLA